VTNAVWLSLLLVGCQHDVATPFPAGLEPLEDNPVPVLQGGDRTETLVTQADDTDFIHIYGRGYALAPPGIVYAGTKNPMVMVAVCSTNQQQITPDNDPSYEFSFLVHYVVNNVLTVEWDDQWRYGTIDGTVDDPTLAMIKHQKIQGSSFITTSEGTVEISATDDPNVTELAFVEHLDSVGGSDADVTKGMQHNYAAIVAAAHGNPIPPCP
jgi:hypothetical protein